MKRHLLAIVAVLLGMALNAQIAVWDGTAEPWTNGSGTPEDPYLIENAQHLAYLAQQVNAPNSHNQYGWDVYADTYFSLTTDLDLGGDHGLIWTPIGKYLADNIVVTNFAGHFDGGGHYVRNMRIEDPQDPDDPFYTNLSYGLFGNAAGGSIKNVTMASDCYVDIKFGYASCQFRGLFVGSLLGYGDGIVLENCANESSLNVTIESSYRDVNCGGLFGHVYNSSIVNCHNWGDVYCSGAADFGTLSTAGIVSCAEGCDIFGCSNAGTVTGVKSEWGEQERGESTGGIVGVVIGNCNIEQCWNTGTLFFDEVYTYNDQAAPSAGGIVGCTYTSNISPTNLVIRNCYSVADISTVTDDPDDKFNYAGGIFGATYGYWNRGIPGHNITIENCYAAGYIVSDTVGGILAHDGWIEFQFRDGSESPYVSNSYYVNTIESSNAYGESVSDDFMKSEEFVNILNTDGVVFIMDQGNTNNGYPILSISGVHSVGEIAANNNVSVYPNPASDIISISFAGEANCHSVEIYSMDGRLVKSQLNGFDAIDISSLSSGVYVMKVRMADGTEAARRIVKE